MSPTKQRTILMYSIGGLFLLGVLWVIIAYSVSATLTLSTNDSTGSLLIHENSPTPRNIDIPNDSPTVTVQLEPGSYTVTATNKVTSTSQVITLGVGERKTTTLNLDAASAIILNTMPVTSLGANSFIATDDHMVFIDSNNPNSPLYMVDQNNHVNLLDGKHPYLTTRWADPTFGIGLVSLGATSYGLVKIDNNSVTNIPLPFTAVKPIAFAVAPNHTWYVSDDHTVYRANADGSFTKVYTTDKQIFVVSAGNDAALLTMKDPNATREGDLIVLHIDGTKYQIDGELYESAWAPSGKKFVTSGDVSEIFDSKLNIVQHLPQGNFSSPTWLDDDTLLYTFGSKVWRYDLKTGKATVMVAIDSSVGSFAAIRPDESHNFLYASIYKSSLTTQPYSLTRVSIGSKQAPDPSTARRLSIILPDTSNGCSINYMNFTALTILTRQTDSGANCVAETKNVTVGSKVLSAGEAANLSYQQLP